MLHSLLAAVGKFNIATEFAKSVTVFDAIRWISSAWNNVPEETILKCFRWAGFASPETELQEDSTSESDLVIALPEALQFEVASEDDILENEANIPVHENITSTAEVKLWNWASVATRDPLVENIDGRSSPRVFEKRDNFLYLEEFLDGIWEIVKKKGLLSRQLSP